MKKIFMIPAGLMALALLVGSSAYAYQGDPTLKGPSYSEDRHNEMVKVFENKNFDDWKELMSERGNARVSQVVTEENFDVFVQIHDLMLEGEIEKAQDLRQEIGLGQRNGLGKENNLSKKSNGPRDGSGLGRNR